MTILADFLRDNQGAVHRIFPDEDGELHISTLQFDDLWSEPVYVIPSDGPIEYQILADSDDTTWYAYVSGGELVLSNTVPTVTGGTWGEPKYGTKVTPIQSAGNVIYELLKTVGSTSIYIYPNSSGELIVTTTAP